MEPQFTFLSKISQGLLEIPKFVSVEICSLKSILQLCLKVFSTVVNLDSSNDDLNIQNVVKLFMKLVAKSLTTFVKWFFNNIL